MNKTVIPLSLLYNGFIMLRVKDLSFQYPSSDSIFKELSFELPAHGLIHLKGANGCGKTTLLKIISNLIYPISGQILLYDKKLQNKEVNFLASGEANFFDQITGQEGIDLFCRLNKTNFKTSKVHFFKEDPLYYKVLNTQFYRMSTGMKRLLLLMICFTKNASVYLLDEPFNGVDKERKSKIIKILKELSKDYLILMTSHQDEFELEYSKVLSLSVLKENSIKTKVDL